MTMPPAYAPPPVASRAQPGSVDDLVVGGVIAVVLAVAGALAGLIWQAWSPAQPEAQVLGGGRFIPDETEAFIAADGRFLVISAALGLVAALLVWFTLPKNRGVAVAAGLIVGGLGGAALTALVGHLTGGGSATGRVVTDVTGAQFRLTSHLPLSLHASGLIFVEAVVAALVYGLFVAFTKHDDLGRPDPVREELMHAASRPAPYGPPQAGVPVAGPLIDAGGQPQYGWGHGDAPGAPQQRDLPPQ